MVKKRCEWCQKDGCYVYYHDQEWGVPHRNDSNLFELLILETMQAGLNWLTILKKREAFRAAFDHFDAQQIVHYNEKKIAQLLVNPEIIRNRLKIVATIKNAKAFLAIQEKYKSFANYLWQFVDGQPIQNSWKTQAQIPAVTPLAITVAKDLKKQGFSFIGPTTCYAYLQAAGLVNDHLTSCFRYREVQTLSAAF